MVPEPPFVLLASDDSRALAALRDALRLGGAQVAACRKVSVAVEAVTFHVPTVIVADVGMEDGRGWDVVYAARSAGQLPTIVLDRLGDASARRAAFAAGADDVVSVPCDVEEFATKVLVLAGRARHASTNRPVHRLHGLVVDVAAHSVRLHGRPVLVTAQQFAILCALFEARGAALGRAQLLARIEGLDDEPPSERAIDLHMTRLRSRLGDSARDARFIESVYGVGYRLATDVSAPAQLGDRAEDVLVALPDPLLVIDAQQRVQFANDAAGRMLARPRAQLVGMRCGEVLRCADCMGLPLEGPRCFARAMQAGATTLRGVPAEVQAGDERIQVTLTYGRVEADGLLTLQIRPRGDDTARGTTSTA